ncbi:M15 family metallopeptidase [Polyangium aurulentum]|uniref:M15 family metallopeptidase n=1 Tax=Polyangium aurulentum TaxID=2567896 RepID=UPI00146D94C6|nr:M15 family metallopeptidase [Polyangium aurulentum]UQA61366.1 M15 family metallopeptidase [Polyangium aurulentum]
MKYPGSTPESGEEINGVKSPCKGWIQIFSHYVDYHITVHDDIAVGYSAQLYRLDGGTASLVQSFDVFYENLKQEDAGPNGDAPEDAVRNGNPRVLIGGTEGYPCGQYRLTLTPEIRHGKLRLRRMPEADGTYVVLNTAGADSGSRTDTYVQVPASTTVETAWSETFELRRNTLTSPQIVEFVWADFRTWDRVTNARITGVGDLIQQSLDASAACIARISANMTAELGANWRQVAVAGAFFPLHPAIRYWAFVFINKTEELTDRNVRITDPGRTPAYQKFLYERHVHCGGDIAAAPWESNHQYGLAFDAAYGRNVDQSPGNAIDPQVLVAKAIGFEWGGEWGRPDYPHYEYPGATSKWTNYRDQLIGQTPTAFTYGNHSYVQTP